MPPEGYSLHVGVNSPSPAVFPRLPPLRGCDSAAVEMARLARSRRLTNALVLTTRVEATAAAVLRWLEDIGRKARSGDLVVLTFAGHGTRARDRRAGRYVQAIVCSDASITADSIHDRLEQFAAGVRIILIAECCYSGLIVSGAYAGSPRRVQANVLLLGAADDDRIATGATPGERLPPFTEGLVSSWERTGGRIEGGYGAWCRAAGGIVKDEMLSDRSLASAAPFEI